MTFNVATKYYNYMIIESQEEEEEIKKSLSVCTFFYPLVITKQLYLSTICYI